MNINRQIKPAPAEKVNFNLPEIQSFSLENGLKVFFVERRNLPILRFNLVVEAGSRFDPPGKKGLTNLMAMVIDEGAGDFNALQLNEEFELLGSNFDINASNDTVFLSLRTLTENKEKSLKLFSDVVNRPHFNNDAFLREQRKILTRILQLNDDPDETANIVFDYHLFGGDSIYAFPVIGYKNDVQSVTVTETRDFYEKFFCPANASIIVVGDSSREEAGNLLEKYFRDWKTFQSKDPAQSPDPYSDNKIYLIHKEDSVQSEIRIGHITGPRKDPGYFNKTIINTVLGGQFTSRINLNLREDKGYTYGAFSRFNYYKDAGYFYVSTSVNSQNTGNAVKEILKELDAVKDGITPDELHFAKSSLIRKFPSTFETNRQIAGNISTLIIHSLPLNYFNLYLDELSQISLDDVNKTAAGIIDPGRALIVVLGDREKIFSQLSGLGREIVDISLPVL